MVLKRLSLVGDALSHVALPGMAVALLLGFHPMTGALFALTLAVLGIWFIQNRSSIYPDALVGLFFTASLAIGILITPEPELLEALFGDIQKITVWESLLAIGVSLAVIIITHLISRRLALATISEELAKSTGILVKTTNLIFYLLVGTVVALGVKFVGTLLMGALVIVPAASAKNISRKLNSYQLWSVIIGIVSAVFGILLSVFLSVSPGPAVVLTSIAIFLLTLTVKSFSKL
jgi:zinc transport system permease protein